MPRLLDLIGGMGRFVRPGQSVLIKPNLLSDHEPKDAVTTHPAVITAVIRAVRAAGGRPCVADSPASAVDLERVWRATGVGALCETEGVPLINLEKAGSDRVERDGFVFTIARPVSEADVVISLPKLKTHVLTHFTGAVKNLYGAVPGYQKTRLHMAYPQPEAFGGLLLAVFRQVRPVLTVADAVMGMDGNGPSGGQPVALGFLAASTDAVALDLVACHRFGINPEEVSYLREARRLGEGAEVPSGIVRVGDVGVLDEGPSCRLPATVPVQRLPDWLLRAVGPMLRRRPTFSKACVSCGQCVKACPAGALTVAPKARPVLNSSRCIECCCCHEVCPVQAIAMKPGTAIRAWQFVRSLRKS